MIYKPIKVLSLFDGISCGMLALERAGIPVERYAAFETDPNPIKISTKNYPHIERYGDVFDGDFTKFKGFDLLIGGSPCTYWSISKSNRETSCNGEGFKLFMQYVRALEESGCKYFLYENNNSIHPNIKDEISKRLGVREIMINSALVSAQHRKRCYWTNIPNVVQPEDRGIYLKDIIDSGITWQDKSYCLVCSYRPTFYDTMSKHRNSLIAEPISATVLRESKNGKGKRIYSVKENSVTIFSKLNGFEAKTGVFNIDLPDGDYHIRTLTPIEAERLQTLPDNYTAGVANSNRYKAIGNSWTVDVIAHIFSNLKNTYSCTETAVQNS